MIAHTAERNTQFRSMSCATGGTYQSADYIGRIKKNASWEKVSFHGTISKTYNELILFKKARDDVNTVICMANTMNRSVPRDIPIMK